LIIDFALLVYYEENKDDQEAHIYTRAGAWIGFLTADMVRVVHAK
jgi:hypothetical protein